MARIRDGLLDFGAVAGVPSGSPEHTQARGGAPRVTAFRAPALLLTGILAVAAVLDLSLLGTRSLSMDESVSVALARLDLSTLVRTLCSRDANMALYYVLLHGWLGLGDTESVIRALSVLMALGSIGAVYVLGLRMFGVRVALLGALLLVVNTYQIRYAQEARSYSLVTLLATLASLAFLEAVAKPTRRNWIVYTVSSVLAVYAHVFAALVLVAHWSSAVLLGRHHIARKGLVASVAIIGLLLSPLAVFAMTADLSNVSWIPKPNLRALYNLSCALTGGAPWGGCGRWGSRLLLALYAGAMLLALAAAVAQFKRASSSFRAWRYGFLVMWCVLPIALALGLSAIKPIFVSRYLIVCLPALVLLASAGIMCLRAPSATVMAVLVFVAAAGYQDVRYYAGLGYKDWRGATAYVLSRSQPQDAVVFSPWYLQPPYDYYHTRLAVSNGPPVVSAWATADATGSPTDEFLKTLPAQYPRIWLLYDRATAPLNPRVLASLAGIYRNKQDFDFRGVGITLYTAR